MIRVLSFVVALVVSFAVPVSAQEGRGVLALLPQDSVTEHVLTTGDKRIPYTATAGTFSLYNTSGERSAAVFYTAYVTKDAGPDRPVTFVFNGGPGAASAFLHLGLVGPQVVEFGDSGHDGAKARLVDNPNSWLAFTDLVMIDPVGAGWSRPAKPDDTSFYGVRQDAQALAKVVALYVNRNSRAASPKYLLGESYGGFRSVRVADALKQDQGIVVSGLVMVSPFLDGALNFGAGRFALGAALQFPSIAATELERRGTFNREAIAEIEKFALTEYLSELAGPRPTGKAADAFYGRVAELTGLPVETVVRTRGFVREAYERQARDNGRVLSNYDIAFAAPNLFPDSSTRIGDPVLDGYVRAYAGLFASYARDQLGFKTDITYTLLNTEANGKWDWGRNTSLANASSTDDLRELLALGPSFRVLIAQGYSDLVTPYGVNKYIVDHLPPAVSDRVRLTLHRGGHMFYTYPQSRAEVSAEAQAFYGGS